MKSRSAEPVVSAVKALVDLGAWGLALYLAAWVRLDFPFGSVPNRALLSVFGVAIAAQATFGFVLGLYRFRWMYGSFDEVSALAITSVSTTIAIYTFNALRVPRPMPRSAILAGGLAALVGMAGARYIVRLMRERWRRPDPDHPDAIRTLVFGAGNAGEQIIRAMVRDRQARYVPVGMLDDDPAKKRLSIAGVRVLGTRADLARVLRSTNAAALLVAVPTADAELISSLTALAEEADETLTVKVLPAVSELIDGHVDVNDIRDVNEVDLLGRHQIETDISEIAGYLRGKRVLVTGAGGSIGSELCRQIHLYSPGELMMLDRDESALHAVQLSIEGRALLDTPNLILADIRDAETILQLFDERKPEVVFHAAALKHLPLLEMYPAEAIKSNVYGTLNILDAAVRSGVERFVNISTDKAANPISVLGYSKRAAELITSQIATTATGSYMSVRFGNVLGSRGSFIHAFRSQIENGGPVTVTDRDVTRYFMTIPEAVQLVIQAGAIGNNGDALILDMGKPVRIADVAKQMIKQSRKDIKIIYSGLRPGEKLHEELVGPTEVIAPTSHKLITRTPVPQITGDFFTPVDIPTTPDKQVDLLSSWCTDLLAVTGDVRFR
jgi:FlaA1/EpsC-like NDP-sugar epimerase